MAATKENPIIFYDLASKDNTPWSPYTYRTRLALIHKGLPFRVEYLSYPDIEPTFKKLGVPQGSPKSEFKYTVPAIADPSAEPNGNPTYIADSWTIALYLERTYPPPTYPPLFPHGSIALHRAMSSQIGRTVFHHLCDTAIPLIGLRDVLDDKGHDHFVRTREIDYGKPLADVLKESDEKWSTEIRDSWASLAEILDMNGPIDRTGPFVMGKGISYSDFCVAGLLLWLRRAESEDAWRWKELLTWDGGRWELISKEVEKLETRSIEV